MTSVTQVLSPSKNVLQQTNNNVPVITELRPEQKDALRRKRRAPRETENRLDVSKSDKLRKVRFEVSSQKYVQSHPYQMSSDETGDEDEDDDEDEEEELVERVRKPAPRPIIPNYVTKNDKGQYRKRRKSKTDALDLSSQRAKPQASITIAKRNARERNRVKLVNQGFATLRSRIPDYISEIYTEEKKKKKVSKVETLRMALGYIRHLTEMLELRSTDGGNWFRFKTDDLWKSASNSSNGYPSPVDTEYQQSPTNGVYGSREPTFYDYIELETVKDLSVKDVDKEEVLDFKDEKESLILPESAFSVSVGCCYDLDNVKQEVPVEDGNEPGGFSVSVGCCYDLDNVKQEAPVEEDGNEPSASSPLPSMTESFPKKNLRAFYEAPPFLSGSSAFHV